MMILNPVTGETIELKVPALTPRLQERADAKAARIAEKVAQREAASRTRREQELDEGVL